MAPSEPASCKNSYYYSCLQEFGRSRRLHQRIRAAGLLSLLVCTAGRALESPSGEFGRADFSRNQALYLTMRDGVRIAIDLWLPAMAQTAARVPTVIRATRYWRALDLVDAEIKDDSNYPEAERFNSKGYALVIVDARGSGASFGTRPYELSEEEVRDYGEVVDWIVAQPWSNGRVGAYGVSYAGNTAEMLTVNMHPAVKAVAPLFNDFDNFGHLVYPGGLLCKGFLEDWGNAVRQMDLNDICALRGLTGERCAELSQKVRGVKPVDGDRDLRMLTAAVEEHRKNTRVYEAALACEFRDDPFGPSGARDVGNRRSPCGHLAEIAKSGTAMLIRVGWQDAATVNGALGRFASIGNPQRVFIGPWDHGARNNADPFLAADTPVQPSQSEQFEEMIEFFDSYLKGSGSDAFPKQITYYTLGAGKWTTTEKWPPQGFEAKQWFFAAGGKLEPQVPSDSEGADRYTVDFEATTGRHNRWFTNGGAGDVIYPDRSAEDRRLLTYTSDPLAADVEITGHPLVQLYLSSTHQDGAVFIYLEDVDPRGRVTYITEGQLRAVMRKISNEKPLYVKFGPHRSEKRVDAMPLVPGEIAELSFDLWATSALVKRGHRIRIAVAGADKDSFERYPRSGSPNITVARSRRHPSHVVLPMKAAVPAGGIN